MRDGKILNPEKLFFEEKGSADVQLDCRDSIIAPGFIDVQINGTVEPRALVGWGRPGLVHPQSHLGCPARGWFQLLKGGVSHPTKDKQQFSLWLLLVV